MSWSGKKIKETFKDLLKINSASDNAGVDSTLREVQDGNGSNTGLKLSDTVVDAAVFTSADASITSLNGATGTGTSGNIENFNSTNVNIDGGQIDGTYIGLDDRRQASFQEIGINGPVVGGFNLKSSVSNHVTNAHTHTSIHHPNYLNASNNNGKIYQEYVNYIPAAMFNKHAKSFIQLRGVPGSKGCAWFELEAWVDDAELPDDGSAGSASGGSGFAGSVPKVRAIPNKANVNGTQNGLHNNDAVFSHGDWTIGHWGNVGNTGSVGSIYEAIIELSDGSGELGGAQRSLSSQSLFLTGQATRPYGTILQDVNPLIKWKYIGDTVKATAVLGPGGDPVIANNSVASITVEKQDFNGNPGAVQGLKSRSVDDDTWGPTGSSSDYHAAGVFFNPDLANYPITLIDNLAEGNDFTNHGGNGFSYELYIEEIWSQQIVKFSVLHPGHSMFTGPSQVPLTGILVQKALDGEVQRWKNVELDITGGRGGHSHIIIDPPAANPATNHAIAVAGYESRIGDSGDGIEDFAISGTAYNWHELISDEYVPTGNKGFFGRWKGFVMSRAEYDTSPNGVYDNDPDYVNEYTGTLVWWANPRQRESKKGKIMSSIPYGSTPIGSVHDFNTLMQDPANFGETASANASNRHNAMIGQLYFHDYSANTVSKFNETAVGGQEDDGLFLHIAAAGDAIGLGGEPEKEFMKTKTGGTWGSENDFLTLKYVFDTAHADDDEGLYTLGYASILDWPDFGRIDYGGVTPVQRPGQPLEIVPLLKYATDYLTIAWDQYGEDFWDSSILQGDWDHNDFFIEFETLLAGLKVIGIGYRIKVWTTPNFIYNVKRSSSEINGG
jgi:hypothetical protein